MIFIYNESSGNIIDLQIETKLSKKKLKHLMELAIYDFNIEKNIIPNNLKIMKLNSTTNLFQIQCRDVLIDYEKDILVAMPINALNDLFKQYIIDNGNISTYALMVMFVTLVILVEPQ